jgi:hypothetical protein
MRGWVGGPWDDCFEPVVEHFMAHKHIALPRSPKHHHDLEIVSLSKFLDKGRYLTKGRNLSVPF